MTERHLKAVPDQPNQPALIDQPIQPPPGRRQCAWCEQPATTTIMISPPTFASRKGKRVMKKTATWADSCREHRRNAWHPLAQPAADRAAAAAEARRLRLAAKNQMTIQDVLEEESPDDPGRPAS